MIAAVLIALALFFAPDPALAKDIYRWTDDSGDTHYGDRVPQQYKSVARKLVPGAGVSIVTGPGARANNERSAPVVSSYRSPVADTAQMQAGNASSSGASGTSGAQGGSGVPDGAMDCNSLRRQYWESQACFNQFRNANGSVKPEAFSQCREVQNPDIQCGPLIIEP